MKRPGLICTSIIFSLIITSLALKTVRAQKVSGNEINNALPRVLPGNISDITEARLRHEAVLRFSGLQLPDNQEEWEDYRKNLRNEIITKAVVHINHGLPLNVREFGTIKMNGYEIKNISFQTLPGVYATANLFIPQGKGPFPAVINLHAHSGRFDDKDQAVAHTLALNGYVCLSIDPWGAGERTTIHGITEYHGANLGASFMNIGESLMGIQISDNMRGIDLLCSLPYVDPGKIGAAGASGGGNQTMWLSAVDGRVKAAVPVVSVGTFESYVMRSNCICELLIDGLNFTEEAGVLALSEAIMPCNHTKDDNPTFYCSEMLRSYNNARKIFVMTGRERNLSFRTFGLPHGFLPEDREAMLGWFALHLKNYGNGESIREKPFKLLTEEELMVYPKGKRDKDVLTTAEYCRMKGIELRSSFLGSTSFNIEKKKQELKDILRIKEKPRITEIKNYPAESGWNRIALVAGNKIIPLLLKPPENRSAGFVIICNPLGKNSVAAPVIDEYTKKGMGIAVADLTGTGEIVAFSDRRSGRSFMLHDLSRAELWLGRTVPGEWVEDLEMLKEYIVSVYNPAGISIDGSREAGIAGLFMGTLDGGFEKIILREAPLSYLFDTRENIDFFSMGIHLPGFLKWGDISLAAAIAGTEVNFIDPVTMSGRKISGDDLTEFKSEFSRIRKICGEKGITVFN
jgi:hypothetical protein